MLFHLGALTWLSLFAHYAKIQMDSIDFSTQDQDECSFQCNLNFFPHCATNGITYINECFFMKSRCLDPKIQLQKMPGIPCGLIGSMDATKYTGCERGCPPVEFPYCGTNGETYINNCALEIATCEDSNVQLAKLPGIPCGSELKFEYSDLYCDGLCSEHYIPYCGSDGVTYINYCEFRKARCRDVTLTVVGFPGLPCDSQIFDEKVALERTKKLECLKHNKCSRILFPICGTDGVTYRNPCEFRRARCKNPTLRRANILVPCGSSLSDDVSNIIENMPNGTSSNVIKNCWYKCTKAWEYPLCGSDGITYSSYCEMRNALCLDPDLRLVKIPGVKCSTAFQFTNPVEIDKCKDECPYGKTLSYMCGSNNQTYYSFCEFSNAICRDPELYLAKPMGFPCRDEDRNAELEALNKEYQTMDEIYFGITNFQNNMVKTHIDESRSYESKTYIVNNNRLSNVNKNNNILNEHNIHGINTNNYDSRSENESNNVNNKNRNNNITNILGYELNILNNGLLHSESDSCEFDCSHSPKMPHCGSNMLTYPSGCAFHRDQCRNSRLQLVAEPGIPCSEIQGFSITNEKFQECIRDCRHSQKIYHCLNTGETIFSYCEFLYLQCLIPGYKIIGHAGIPCDDIHDYKYHRQNEGDSNTSSNNWTSGDENEEFQRKLNKMLSEIPSYEYTGIKRLNY
ncbi:extracellular protein [Cryptosporidium bovis]|uniref:extracellular protein n=1 Tax=Cryptosporidium bovis TaxID=310047 RepID=UPI003519EBDD|nr:extracellular protein [Cryptosporidium bovis]